MSLSTAIWVSSQFSKAPEISNMRPKLVRWLHSQWVIVAVVNVTYKITMIIGLKERVALVNVTYKITMIIGLKERVALAVGCRGKRHLQNHNDYRKLTSSFSFGWSQSLFLFGL